MNNMERDKLIAAVKKTTDISAKAFSEMAVKIRKKHYSNEKDGNEKDGNENESR